MDRVFKLIKKEEERQASTLMMIPSENFAWPEVREALGSVLMHKYSEGQPGKRYYQGNRFVDKIELLAKKRALEVFGLNDKKWSANVQALSGSPANLAVYNALLEPGQRILSMYLPDGGHLSHGWQYKGKKITLVSKVYDVAYYHVDPDTQVLDYGEVGKIAKKSKPKIIVSGGTAYPREIDHRAMGKIAKAVGAYYLADVAHEAGLIAAGVNSPPFAHADVVTMTTHKTLRGPRGAIILSRKKLGEQIDKSVFPGIQGGPHNHAIAAVAVALKKAKTREFKKYAEQVVKNANVLASELSTYGFEIVSGGTDKHLILVDLHSKNITGRFLAEKLEKVGIIVNANTVPGETGSPVNPSGIRLGTQAITAAGLREKDMKEVAKRIYECAYF